MSNSWQASKTPWCSGDSATDIIQSARLSRVRLKSAGSSPMPSAARGIARIVAAAREHTDSPRCETGPISGNAGS